MERPASAPLREVRKKPVRVFVLLLDDTHMLDLGGPVQCFYEANTFGAEYEQHFVGPRPMVRSAEGVVIAQIEPLPEVTARDTVLVPGINSARMEAARNLPLEWLRKAHEAGARIASICSGAFLLARAGLLGGRECTTHWKLIQRLQSAAPAARVQDNTLFVTDRKDNRVVITSAGVASGIDMALALVENDFGPIIALRTAREMVLYMRRSGDSEQSSVYLEFRSHLHSGIHRVQDWIMAHPGERASLEQLSKVATMSSRHLTRVFRRATGISLKEYELRVKLQFARDLLQETDLPIEDVATRCGFKDARSLRRLWAQELGSSPSAWRRSVKL